VIPISPRYALPLLGLLLLALIPAVIQQLNPRRIDSCKMPEALKATSLIPGAQARGERLEKRNRNVIQWSEGEIEVEVEMKPGRRRRPELGFQIIRTYDARPIYERPVSLVEGAPEPEQHFIRQQQTAAGTVPIHVVVDKTGRQGRVIAYLFVYDDEPVAMPFWSQAKNVFRELVTGARPLTLFLVDAKAAGRPTQAVADRATEWLGGAWEYFDEMCRG